MRGSGYTMSMLPTYRKCVFLLTALLVTVVVADACNIPVFRFALERWQPDACELIVFHDVPLSAAQDAFVAQLETASPVRDGATNIRVTRANTTALADESLTDMWVTLRSQPNVRLPWLVARTRLGKDRTINHWQGSLEDGAKAGLLQSPVRTELCRRLLAGDSIVWLLLKSRTPERNAGVRDLLTKQLRDLPRQVSLPEGIGLPGSELHSEVPLLLKFTLLEVDPDDPQEQFLVRLLSGLQAEAFSEGEPLVVPVFGRGRALEVIPASQLDAGLIEDLTVFLSGACSCQVKEQNPGFDLVLSTDWNLQLFGEGVVPPGPGPEAGAGQQRSREPVLLPIPPGRKNR